MKYTHMSYSIAGIGGLYKRSNDMKQENPPPEAFRKRQSIKWGPITNALMIRPNRWYRIQVYERPKSASSAVTTLKKLYRGQGFEFVHSNGKVCGRYVGKTSKEVIDTAP